MIRWSPGTELANLHGQMDRLFDDFFGPSTSGAARPEAQRPLPTYYLPLDIKEVENGYQITTPIPGFTPEEVDVTFSEGVLKISAQHSQQSSQEQSGYLRREIAFGNYHRAIQLPGDVNEDDISAAFENGMLTVTVPKAPRPQPKRIQVKAGAKKQMTGAAS